MKRLYAFEKLDVYHAANQLARIVGAVSASLPGKKDPEVRKMIRANVLLGISIAGANAELPDHDNLSLEERRNFARLSISSAHSIRSVMLELRREKLGSQSHISAGLELLERIQRGLEDNLQQLRPGFDPCEYASRQQRRK
jgi:hypothetical protein